ncbi:hypothetical protein ACLOJK_030966 [Asimina triloba]
MTMPSLRTRPEKDKDCSPSPSPSSSEQFHVLAVDDSLVDRKVIERLLKISAYKVTTVESGKRALQLLGLDGDNSTALEVNMIITDYSMPEVTGYDLLKKIKVIFLAFDTSIHSSRPAALDPHKKLKALYGKTQTHSLFLWPLFILCHSSMDQQLRMDSEKSILLRDRVVFNNVSFAFSFALFLLGLADAFPTTDFKRCLEEGAEEFITKPVKLSDVKRLRSYILKGGEESGSRKNKRKCPPSPPPSSREEIRRKISLD